MKTILILISLMLAGFSVTAQTTNVSIGTVANDHTGAALRNAINLLNQNDTYLSTRISTATNWDDVVVPAFAAGSGQSAPSPGAFGPSGALQALMFQPSTIVDQLYFTCQLPHRWLEGSPLHPHIHWSRTANPGSASATNVVWGIEYSFATIEGTFLAPTTLRITNGVASANWVHQLSEFEPAITHTTNKVSSVLVGRIFRDATNTSDTYDQNAALLSFDIHIIQNSLGSTEELVK